VEEAGPGAERGREEGREESKGKDCEFSLILRDLDMRPFPFSHTHHFLVFTIFLPPSLPPSLPPYFSPSLLFLPECQGPLSSIRAPGRVAEMDQSVARPLRGGREGGGGGWGIPRGGGGGGGGWGGGGRGVELRERTRPRPRRRGGAAG